MVGEKVSPRLEHLIAIFLAILTWGIVSLINWPVWQFDPVGTWILSPFLVAYAMLIPLLWWRHKPAFPVAMAVLILGIVALGMSTAIGVALANYLMVIWNVFAVVLKAVCLFFCYTAYKELR